MGQTPIYGLRFQELSDPPDGPDLGANLAADVEDELERIDGTNTAQAAELASLDGRVIALEGLLIQHGVANIVLVSQNTASVVVNFPEPFAAPPQVVGNSPNSLYGISCSAATTTQFELRARHIQQTSGDADLDCDWIAIGPRA